MTKIQNPKQEKDQHRTSNAQHRTSNVDVTLVLVWNLEFVIYLKFGIWNL